MVSWARVRILAQSETASSTSRSTSIRPASRSSASSVRARTLRPDGRQHLHVHPGLGSDWPGRVCASSAVRIDCSVAVEVAADEELGMEDLADAPALAERLHGDRVDQERSIVGDDLDHGGPAGRPAVVGGWPASRMSMMARAAGRCSASR